MKPKRMVIFAGGVMILFMVLGLLVFKKPSSPDKIENLRVGVLPDSISALLYIAKQQGMFKRHGLEVLFENYQAGAYAVNDLSAGKVDVATAIEFVLVLRGLRERTSGPSERSPHRTPSK